MNICEEISFSRTFKTSSIRFINFQKCSKSCKIIQFHAKSCKIMQKSLHFLWKNVFSENQGFSLIWIYCINRMDAKRQSFDLAVLAISSLFYKKKVLPHWNLAHSKIYAFIPDKHFWWTFKFCLRFFCVGWEQFSVGWEIFCGMIEKKSLEKNRKSFWRSCSLIYLCVGRNSGKTFHLVIRLTARIVILMPSILASWLKYSCLFLVKEVILL